MQRAPMQWRINPTDYIWVIPHGKNFSKKGANSMRKMWRIWKMWQKKEQETMHFTIFENELTSFKKLINEMDAHPDVVFNCALGILTWIVQHAKEGGELLGQNGSEEFGLAFSYKNKHGQTVVFPSQDDYSDYGKSCETLWFSDDDKRFFRDIGIEPD